jgi:hypothetical protein
LREKVADPGLDPGRPDEGSYSAAVVKKRFAAAF